LRAAGWGWRWVFHSARRVQWSFDTNDDDVKLSSSYVLFALSFSFAAKPLLPPPWTFGSVSCRGCCCLSVCLGAFSALSSNNSNAAGLQNSALSLSLCPAILLSFGARSPERRTYRNSFRVHGCISLFMFCEGKCRVHRLSAEPRERVREYRYVAGAVAACATCGCSFLLFAVPLTLSSSFPPLIFVGYNGYNLNSFFRYMKIIYLNPYLFMY